MRLLSHRSRICPFVRSALFSLWVSHALGQNLTFNGRFANTNAIFPQTLSWAASSIELTFQGARTVTIALSKVPGTGSSQIEIRVDSKIFGTTSTGSTTPKNVSIPVEGTPGMHTLVMTKLTEAGQGEAQVDGVWLDTGSFGPPRPNTSDRRVEIIGASISNGLGDMGPAVGCQGWSQTSDALLAYGPLVANHYGASFSLLAWSGAGILRKGNLIYKGGGGEDLLIKAPPTIPELYLRTVASDPSSTFDQASFVPQVILLEIGDNDFSGNHEPPSGWADKFKAFLQQIRTNAPDAYMILLITPVNVQSPIRGHTSAQMAARERARQIQELQAQGFQKLYLLELPPSVMQGSEVGCYGHPSSATQANMAAVVQDFVANLTQWTPVATQTPLSTDIPMQMPPGVAPAPAPLLADAGAPLMAPMPVYPAAAGSAPGLAPALTPLPVAAPVIVPGPVPVPMPAPVAVPMATPLPGAALPLPAAAATTVPAPVTAPMTAGSAVPVPAPMPAPMATAAIGSDFTAPSI
ncbi:hypothetical protein CVIRNUC_007804 [Coccomyxa viridis]|uniref:Carbohydrate esterase 2 N-terminal domain-containing protein n=1 Tax=Coccomyxa viridis TaxID=1274662 RepID=A0AAV1IDR9_9CHLO|nr:hypothetical protein CVIRNUC_007804 [Coccomyxa viridis]